MEEENPNIQSTVDDSQVSVRLLTLGFCGYAKSGKNTAAETFKDVVETRTGIPVTMMAFADGIRQIGKVFGFADEVMENQGLKETWKHPMFNITPRRFMQLVGSEMFRNHLDKDCWVKLTQSRLGNISNYLIDKYGPRPSDQDGNIWKPQHIVCITDVRFPNEEALIRKFGGRIIRIDRDIKRDGKEWMKHESEKYIEEIKPHLCIKNSMPTPEMFGLHASLMILNYLHTSNVLLERIVPAVPV